MAVEVLAKELVRIDGFLMDVIFNEEHGYESEVTEYPVESGANVTDNIRPRPIRVSMECLVSNTPIGQLASSRGPESGEPPPADSAYDHLLKIYNRREPVPIFTTLRVYENMALVSLSIPRSQGRGDELRFTAEFQQVQLVTNKRTRRVAVPQAKGKKTVTKAPNPGKDVVMINQTLHKWGDASAGCWRKSALRGSDVRSDIDPKWVLRRSTPDLVSDAEWREASIERKKAIERETLKEYISLRGVLVFDDASKNSLDNNFVRDIIAVPKSEVIFAGLSNIT